MQKNTGATNLVERRLSCRIHVALTANCSMYVPNAIRHVRTSELGARCR
jgi:hypothetical protein